MKWHTGVCAIVLAVAFASGALAQERKAYRHVDAAGNVTYSQTPPADGKEAKQVDITPAQRGRGGNTRTYSSYDNPGYYSGQTTYNHYPAQTQSYQAAREQQLAAIKADCERQRGVDCNNPATLQYLESTTIPRRGRYY